MCHFITSSCIVSYQNCVTNRLPSILLPFYLVALQKPIFSSEVVSGTPVPPVAPLCSRCITLGSIKDKCYDCQVFADLQHELKYFLECLRFSLTRSVFKSSISGLKYFELNQRVCLDHASWRIQLQMPQMCQFVCTLGPRVNCLLLIFSFVFFHLNVADTATEPFCSLELL